ncbi:tRNA uridine-5-carboxymethylaminomethyl(34) synthesis GTPase MnmE [Thermoclostridium stercorarium]|uniref:tRNA modification GTPase MnmE n=1 Tax=Thermoclostridium stercorarium subsp. leptospartum DSM 9219 TaxID=1346611 RepID=A0A1B1YP69_THEST|nr:tRNA uridine-5-carboxymethylaminomethyl(34) synthesis GTPase MnmE [Thermoclostridium stercorarium]ANX02570.1 tRNA modification GTPase [Thermoclostridium stercorarium subsp. leptospartum DSM 9219]UZQ87009.1 tRNA uridine-5-carboxymethylaminomethyl(34) synthesis GTPase MnmE [Thermoclostridium stercorarium]
MRDNDTIAAVATAVGNAGISIIRMSGSEAFNIASKIFKGKGNFMEYPSHTIRYGKIVDPETNEVIDEVLVSKMAAPKTYTTEDVVEINCHGGFVTARRILDLLFRLGARPAEPGEFTKRAFINGRIDLVQAEAIMDLIGAVTEKSSKAAVMQLEGRLSEKLNKIRESLVNILAKIEVNLDYPEYDFEEVTTRECVQVINGIKGDLKTLIESFDYGKVLREGLNVAIIGKPNAGKSSLLNRLSGKNRAIVTDIPGTTRDILEEYVNIQGLPVRLLDTAGLRETTDVVEKIGVEKALEVIDTADLIIFMLDAQTGFEKEDRDILEKIRRYYSKVLYVVNKTDRPDKEKLEEIRRIIPETIEISVLEDYGIDNLEKAILEFVNKARIDTDNQIIVTNARHKKLLNEALENLNSAVSAAENGMTLDLISMDIKNAAEKIGFITGHEVTEEVVMNIFENFCIGK